MKEFINNILSLMGGKSNLSSGKYKPVGGINTKQFEGLRLHVYKDTVGKATIGYGHNLQGGSDVHLARLGLNRSELISGSRDLTQEEADKLFDLDYDDALINARRLVPKLDSMPPVVKAVLGDLSFNMGYGTLSTFKRTLAAFNASEWEEAADDLRESEWYNQVKSRAIAIISALHSVN